MNITASPLSSFWSWLSLLAPPLKGSIKRRLSLSEAVRQASAIRQLLNDARVRANASRVVLYQFHNGGVFINKNPRWYLAVADEVLAPNIGPAILGDFSTFASRCTGLIDQLWDAETPNVSRCPSSLPCQAKCQVKLPIVDVETMEPGYARACLIEAGAKKLIQAPIKDDQGIVGYLSVEFCGEVENLDDSCKIACACAERIGMKSAAQR